MLKVFTAYRTTTALGLCVTAAMTGAVYRHGRGGVFDFHYRFRAVDHLACVAL